MKLVAILSWYDEDPAWLAAAVASLARAGVEHLVAVDGAYLLYPDPCGSSPGEQHDVIVETCRGAGIGLTLHVPAAPWVGNEVEKRTFGFTLARTVTQAFEDWYLLCDADAYIETSAGLELLEHTDADVAEITLAETYGSLTSLMPLRCLFRAIPGLRVAGRHSVYLTPGGVDLGNGAAQVCRLPGVTMVHRRRNPAVARRQRQLAYYERRDREGVEA